MGRVLPVFLAILFVSGAEQTASAVAAALAAAQSRPADARRSLAGADRGDRAVLCLLPALLTQSCQAVVDHHQDFATVANPAALATRLSLAGFTRQGKFPLLSLPPLPQFGQRPPPLV